MILLALDTCDVRGSVAVLRDEATLAAGVHDTAEDYSSWLLPAVERVLVAANVTMKEVDVYAVASGPGSFTGLRVGLTTVKAWSEVYGKPIVSVSRLEALASEAGKNEGFVAAILDGQRDQIFGALYRMDGGRLERVVDETVTAAERFVELVGERVGSAKVAWITLAEDKIRQVGAWAAREKTGDTIESVQGVMAAAIGRIGYQRALEKRVTDALRLDANYVRRPDAEIFWKGGRAAAVEGKGLTASARIRRIRAEDAGPITEILAESPEAANWAEESFENASGLEGMVALVSEREGRLGGFIIARQVADEGEVLNLAVRRESRRKGEGGGLLEAALAELKAGGVTHVYLEVRESNAGAAAFYERQGFTKTGQRKGYYRNPEEAAVLLEKKLTG